MKMSETKEYLQGINREYLLAMSAPAFESGLIGYGYMNVPGEILILGNKLLWNMMHRRPVEELRKNPIKIYNKLFQDCFRLAVLITTIWHNEKEKLNFDDIDIVLDKAHYDFIEYTNELIEILLGLEMNCSQHGFLKLMDDMFDCWFRKIDSEEGLDNRTDNYIVASLMAVYFIGAWMILDRFGYRDKV